MLSNDTDKLRRWVEHFAEVSSCSTAVSQLNAGALPDITVMTPSYQEQFPDDEDLTHPITEGEIEEAMHCPATRWQSSWS